MMKEILMILGQPKLSLMKIINFCIQTTEKLIVIQDMEKLKQKLHEHIHEARYHLKLAREPHRNLVVSERRIKEHTTSQRYRKIQGISDGEGVARSLLH
nr:DNA mismatch repair protein MutS, core [Tanacetum cinerariifolium]